MASIACIWRKNFKIKLSLVVRPTNQISTLWTKSKSEDHDRNR